MVLLGHLRQSLPMKQSAMGAGLIAGDCFRMQEHSGQFVQGDEKARKEPFSQRPVHWPLFSNI